MRCDDSILTVSNHLGIVFDSVSDISDLQRQQIVVCMAEVLVSVISGSEPDSLLDTLLLTEPLSWSVVPEEMSFSGGVSEFIYGRESQPFAISHTI